MEREGFAWDAELYDKSSRMQYRLGEMAIERLDPRPGERVLEIGTGNGRLSIEIADEIQGGTLVGIEISPEQCAQARTNIKKREIPNIDIRCMNALDMEFHSEFDAVFSNSAIHWILDLETVYGLLLKALKPGGRIMMQTGLREVNELFMFIFRIMKMEGYREYLENFKLPWRFLTQRENEKMLENIGFRKVKVEPYHYQMKFKNDTEMWNYCKAAPLVPFLSEIPPDKHEQFLKRAKTIYYDVNEDHPLEIRMNRAFISAVK